MSGPELKILGMRIKGPLYMQPLKVALKDTANNFIYILAIAVKSRYPVKYGGFSNRGCVRLNQSTVGDFCTAFEETPFQLDCYCDSDRCDSREKFDSLSSGRHGLILKYCTEGVGGKTSCVYPMAACSVAQVPNQGKLSRQVKRQS